VDVLKDIRFKKISPAKKEPVIAPEAARAIAKEAYVYGFPMVDGYRIIHSYAVDVSELYDVKRRSLACHVTQFAPAGAGAVSTRLTSVRFHQLIESRDAHFGAQLGVAFAEGFVVKPLMTRPHLLGS